MYPMGNTKIHLQVNACVCMLACRRIMLEKKGRHCEGKEENTGKATEGKASYNISAENYKGLHSITTYFTILLGIKMELFFFFNIAILPEL